MTALLARKGISRQSLARERKTRESQRLSCCVAEREQKGVREEAGRQADRQTGKQTDRPAGRQADTHTHTHTHTHVSGSAKR